METKDKSKYAEFARARNKVKTISKRAQKELERNICGNLKDSPKQIKERIPDLERLDGSCIHRHRENRQAVKIFQECVHRRTDRDPPEGTTPQSEEH